MYILLHIRLCGRVSDKEIFTRPISGNKITFFGLRSSFVPYPILKRLFGFKDTRIPIRNTPIFSLYLGSSSLKDLFVTILRVNLQNY